MTKGIFFVWFQGKEDLFESKTLYSINKKQITQKREVRYLG